MKLLLKIIFLFIPPFLYLENIKKLKIFILEGGKNPKNFITFEKAFFKRHAFINKAVCKFSNCTYLEIGVAANDVFNSIPLPINQKYGIDPFSGGNYRMTSDSFFEKYSSLKFNVIFIDGLHHYLACQRDVLNSMKALKQNGIIFIDDMLPRNRYEEATPRQQSFWTGDVWKVAVELLNSKNVVFKIINIDSGIGVLKLKDNFEYKRMPELENKKFEDFLQYHKNFEIINSEDALNFISS